MSLSTLTAAELYEAIWSTPLSHLATRWRVNAHALGQLIDSVGMPRPKSGYWTQKVLGKPLTVSDMPDTLSPTRIIDLTLLQSKKREKTRLTPAPLATPTTSLRAHPLLKGIKASMKHPSFNYDFLMVQAHNNDAVARLDVSPAMQSRAIAILHTLFFHFKHKGWTVSVDKHRYAKRLTNIVNINDESVTFRLRERLRQVPRELDKKEQDEKAKGKPIWHEKINMPSGCLQLIVEGALPRGSRGLFEDNATLTLENQLAHVLTTLETSAEHTKVVRAEREAEKQRWEAQRRQKEAIEQRVRTQHARINTFTGLFTQWKRANDCRAFIDALLATPAYQDFTQEEKNVLWCGRVRLRMLWTPPSMVQLQPCYTLTKKKAR
ncbi:hypothetical protein [Alteromonas gracilis]|uniref:hypothetical protein n=1 Tax=Alteromonas gracilis TaxID=1479524 RepID=UPI003219F04D